MKWYSPTISIANEYCRLYAKNRDTENEANLIVLNICKRTVPMNNTGKYTRAHRIFLSLQDSMVSWCRSLGVQCRPVLRCLSVLMYF